MSALGARYASTAFGARNEILKAKRVKYTNVDFGDAVEDVEDALDALKAAVTAVEEGGVTGLTAADISYTNAGLTGPPTNVEEALDVIVDDLGLLQTAIDATDLAVAGLNSSVSTIQSGYVNTLTDAVTGAGKYTHVGGTATAKTIKALTAGTGISLTSNTNDISVANSGVLTVTNATASYNPLVAGTSANPTIKSIQAGSGITVTANADNLSIASSASSSPLTAVDFTCGASTNTTISSLTAVASTAYSIHYWMQVMYSEGTTGSLNPWQYYHGNINGFIRSDGSTLSATFGASGGGNSIPYGSTASFEIVTTGGFRFRFTNATANPCKVKGQYLLTTNTYA